MSAPEQGSVSSADPEARPAGASPSYEECADRIDELERIFRSGIITQREHEQKLLNALTDYFEDDRPDDDLDLLIDYARTSIAHRATDLMSGDRVVLDRFDRSIKSILCFPVAQAELRSELDHARRALKAGDSLGSGILQELCAHGYYERFRIYMYRANAFETLSVASELGVIDALVDAVHPHLHHRGQIGAPDYFHGEPRRAAFDHLAHLATGDGASAETAREALVDLSSYLTTAGPAVVRLPAHRLSSAQRATLLRNLEWWEDLLIKDPILLPAEGSNRIPDAIRSVLWLANDSTHLP